MKYLLALLPILLLVDAAPADCNARPGRRPRPSGWRHKGRPSASVAPVPSVKGEAAVPPSAVTTTTIADSDTTAVPQPAENTPAPAPQPEPIVAGENAPGNAANANAQPRSSSKSTTQAAAPAQTSAAAAAAAPAPAPVSGVSPVGLAINYVSKPNVASFGGNIGWYYSWNLDTLPNTGGLEFVPMVHGADMANSFSGNVPAGTKNILGFNEPDIGPENGGSAIAPAQAADLHKKWTAKVPAGIRIGSPAVARGGKKWMDDWLSACGGGCNFDFVPFHFYGGAGSAKDLIAYAKDFHATYNKPLWVTEFACHDYGTGAVCNVDQVKEFMQETIGWFRGEGKGIVERWSYFGAFPEYAKTNANGLENTDGGANAVGLFYGLL